MENILNRIRDIRKDKGYSYENMAEELKITAPAYRKIEANQTKLTVERLKQIAEVLDTPVSSLLDETAATKTYHQNNHDNGTFIVASEFENYYQENKETTQKLIHVLEEEIEHLKSEIEFLRSKK